MPILVQTIHDRILSALDAEDSERYIFEKDTKPAINFSVGYVTSLFNEAFGSSKLSPESLRELVKTKVWQANSYSRVAFNESEVGHKMWSLLAVYPKPVTNKKSFVPSGTADSVSKFRPDVSVVSMGKAAKRLTHEEWADGENNIFTAGNSILKGSLIEYAYLEFSDYTSSTYPGSADKLEITIRPSIPKAFVAMAYLKYPSLVSSIGDSIEFPESLTDLITEVALNKISTKQGDGTNLWQISAQNVNRLVSLMR